jgi:MYXO-CTERM domain-containing protein
MTTFSRLLSVSSALFALFAALPASAQENPCGKFDFSNGISCRIEVKGGCEAKCTPLSFEAACQGSCTADVNVSCTGDCEVQCNAQCDPGKLDCSAGCDAECESRCNAECTLDDCSEECAASCHSDCSASCTGTAATCEANCNECCHGACSATANINCDVSCYADLKGGCDVQCQDPSGALFCNDQYVAAGDIDACITYIQDNYNGEVNVEARGEVTCDLNGCLSSTDTKLGYCSVSNIGALAGGTGGVAAAALALGAALARRRRSSKK